MEDWTAFGRIDADGTVFVKTAEGELEAAFIGGRWLVREEAVDDWFRSRCASPALVSPSGGGASSSQKAINTRSCEAAACFIRLKMRTAPPCESGKGR